MQDGRRTEVISIKSRVSQRRTRDFSKGVFTLQDFPVLNKYVLVRVDFNVPLDKKGRVKDDFKIQQALPTIEYIVKQGGVPVLLSHLGRPVGREKRFSMKQVSKSLQRLTKYQVIKCGDCVGKEVSRVVREARKGSMVLLENVRFHPEEEKNDFSFARSLAGLADFFVMDAFGTMHREHASVVGIPDYLPSAMGFLVQKELEVFDALMNQPKHPFVAILGGAKISTKIGVIEQLAKKVDSILVGGAMALTFYKAQGYCVGKSFVEDTALAIAKKLQKNVVLPSDFVVSASLKGKGSVVVYDKIPENSAAYDIGPKTVQEYKDVLAQAKMVFWNGPLGLFEEKQFARATSQIAQYLTTLHAKVVIGGGETADAVHGLEDKLTHVSTGGGAALELLEKGTLPGIIALRNSYKKYIKK